MKLVMHIGMGKTGTTSIQRALAANQRALADQRAAYLGMWFDMLDPSFTGLMGQRRFVAGDAEQMRRHADNLLAILARRAEEEGIDTFVYSNEAMFPAVRAVTPFVAALQERLDLQLVAYLRDPHGWLPSAYTQWGIRHKGHAGPVQPFAERARTLVEAYEDIRPWVEGFPDALTVRRFDRGTDVVADFAEVAGLSLPPPDRRHLERDEPVETMLRAEFNSLYPGEVLPDRFNRVVINTDRRRVPTVEQIADLCLRHDGLEEVVDEKRDLFEFVRETLGLDFLDDATEELAEPPDSAALRSRVVDYLLQISLEQARRIHRLETMVEDLRGRVDAGPGAQPTA